MSIKISTDEIAEIQQRYNYLINYEADDPTSPIDPLTYSDSNGDYLLHIAAQHGDLRTIEILLSAGVDVNQIGDMGCTALHYAKQKGHNDVVHFLISNGASSDIKNSFGKIP